MKSEIKSRRQCAGMSRIVCVILIAFSIGIVGCGGGGGSSTNGGANVGTLDRSADFAISTEPANATILIKPGQTLPIALDLISANGFSSRITLAVSSLQNGLTAAFATPTVSSLPKGITKVILNVTAPAGIRPIVVFSAAQITATGGGLTRTLNSGVLAARDGGNLSVATAGLLLEPLADFSPFIAPFAFTVADVTGKEPLTGVGQTGPVTVTVTSSTPGIAATVLNPIFTPAGPTGIIQDDVQIRLHIDPIVEGGTYPLRLTATAADGTKSTATVVVFIKLLQFVAAPTLTVSGAAGSSGSIESDVVIAGASGTVVQLSLTSPTPNIGVAITPSTVTIPTSHTITQHITLQAQVLQTSSPGTYRGGMLTGTLPDGSSQSVPYTIEVK